MLNFIEMITFGVMFGVAVLAAAIPIMAGALLFVKVIDSMSKEK